MRTDYDAGYRLYLERFHVRFGELADGAKVQLESFAIEKLSRADFKERLDTYLQAHAACKKMIAGGSTISEPVAVAFQIAAAWLAIDPPDVLGMFRGELGDPTVAAPRTE